MLPVLVILFIVVPIAELAILIQVGQAIGVGWTILVLIADAVLGSILAKTQGRAAWRRFSEALQAGRPPTKEVLDGVLVLVGSALLLTPGFISDVLGLALLIPPTRVLFRRILARRLTHRMVASMTARAAQRKNPFDVEGTAAEADPPRRIDAG